MKTIKQLIILVFMLVILVFILNFIKRKPFDYSLFNHEVYMYYEHNLAEIDIVKMDFQCGGIKKINISGSIIYGEIVVEDTTRIAAEFKYPNTKEFKKACNGYFIVDIKNNIKNTGLSEIEYNEKLKEYKIEKEAIDFYKFISRYGRRMD